MTEGTPCAVKAACTVWSGGKPGDNLKGLPITISGKDQSSQQEDKGYGKEILCCFKKFIEQFEALTNIKIDRIYGQLSYKDYKNWEKLIYLYFSIYSVKPMIIDHKHTPLEFIKTMNSYSDKVVDFEIIL